MENYIGEARRRYAGKVGKFTQEDAAKFFGVSLSTYKKWEQGQGMMNGEQLRIIAMKYGVTVDYLLGINARRVTSDDGDILASDERELLFLYRRMDAENRARMMDNARAFAALSEKDGAGNRADVERAGGVVAR